MVFAFSVNLLAYSTNACAVYNGKTEKGFRWDDPDIAIDWPIENPILSDRDRNALFFRELFEQQEKS